MYDMYRSVLRCETIIGTVVFTTNATQTPNMAAQPVVDSTFTKQFSRKLREIETHSDYGNIEIVVRQGTRVGLKRKTALVGKKCPKFEIHYGGAAFEARSVIIY